MRITSTKIFILITLSFQGGPFNKEVNAIYQARMDKVLDDSIQRISTVHELKDNLEKYPSKSKLSKQEWVVKLSKKHPCSLTGKLESCYVGEYYAKRFNDFLKKMKSVNCRLQVVNQIRMDITSTTKICSNISSAATTPKFTETGNRTLLLEMMLPAESKEEDADVHVSRFEKYINNTERLRIMNETSFSSN